VNFEHRPTKILITGKSGCGKSTYFLAFVTRSNYRTKFIFDHEGEFSHKLKIRSATNAAELIGSLRKRVILFDPVAMFPGDIPGGFAFFCEWVFEMSKRLPGKKLFACDELQKMVDPHRPQFELNLILETGRRYELDAVFISHQPNLLHNRTRQQVTEVVTFLQGEACALPALELWGISGRRAMSLKPGQYLVRNVNTGAEASGKVF
jgi:hypothetical protein